jgi:hypothetical protein
MRKYAWHTVKKVKNCEQTYNNNKTLGSSPIRKLEKRKKEKNEFPGFPIKISLTCASSSASCVNNNNNNYNKII